MTNEKSKVSLDDIYQLIKEVKGDLSSKIENINKEVKILTNKIDQEFNQVKTRIDKLEGENFELIKKLEVAERKLKKNNLIFYGVKETNKETQNNLINKIEKIATESMGITFNKSDVSNCYRIGKGNSLNKPVLLNFISQIKRNEILNHGKKLKGTNIYVREDFIEKDLQEQKVLVKHLKAARNNNQKAIIKGNKLYIDNQAYSVQDLEKPSTYRLVSTRDYSPPPIRLTNSEPSTPLPQSFEEEGISQETIIANKEQTESQNPQDKNDKKKKIVTRKPSADQTPKRNQLTRSVTQSKK